MQHHAADQLHIEMVNAQYALAGFAHYDESLRQQFIKHRTLAKLGGMPAQVVD